MPDDKMVKGAVMNGYLRFVKRKWGIEGVKEALNHVGLSVNPKDSEWISAETANEVLIWIRDTKGPEYVEYAGRYASTDLGVFTQMIASLISIEKFIKRAQDTYRTLFNYGEFLIEENDNGAIITIKDVRHPGPSCIAWEGALQGILAITKTEGKVTPIEPDSEEDCKYVVEWK